MIGRMRLGDVINRGLDWLATPRYLPGRLEMETCRGQRWEVEVVSFALRFPVANGGSIRLPVFVTLWPRGTSAVPATISPPERRDES